MSPPSLGRASRHWDEYSSVRRALPRHALLALIRSIVVSKTDYCSSVLAGMYGHFLSRLQPILNAAARLVFSARKSDHVSPLRHRIRFRLCILVFRCLHGTAPIYLADSLRRTADVNGRRRLRSSVSDTLVVAPTNRSTLGDRGFPVAASRAWNGLPSSARAASSLSSFR